MKGTTQHLGTSVRYCMFISTLMSILSIQLLAGGFLAKESCTRMNASSRTRSRSWMRLDSSGVAMGSNLNSCFWVIQIYWSHCDSLLLCFYVCIICTLQSMDLLYPGCVITIQSFLAVLYQLSVLYLSTLLCLASFRLRGLTILVFRLGMQHAHMQW